jgi:hypothetical protein
MFHDCLFLRHSVFPKVAPRVSIFYRIAKKNWFFWNINQNPNQIIEMYGSVYISEVNLNFYSQRYKWNKYKIHVKLVPTIFPVVAYNARFIDIFCKKIITCSLLKRLYSHIMYPQLSYARHSTLSNCHVLIITCLLWDNSYKILWEIAKQIFSAFLISPCDHDIIHTLHNLDDVSIHILVS